MDKSKIGYGIEEKTPAVKSIMLAFPEILHKADSEGISAHCDWAADEIMFVRHDP